MWQAQLHMYPKTSEAGAQLLDKLLMSVDKHVRRIAHEPADLLHVFRCA